VAPKNPTPDKDKSGLIYQVYCKDCDAVYISETGHSLGCRVKEHGTKDMSVVFK